MSDELIKSLQRRVSDLETENLTLKSESKDRRLANKKLKEDYAKLEQTVTGLTADRDNYKRAAEASDPEKAQRIAELEGVIRTTKHKSAFAKEAAAQGVMPEAIEDLWTLSGYKAQGDEPDASAIASAIASAKTSRSYLFRPAATETAETTTTATTTGATPEKPKLEVPLDNARGNSRVDASVFKVTTANMQDARWMRDNQAKIVEHRKAGTLVMGD